ncbi:MAG TPA: hypothetical protein VM888_09705 [Chitinophagaceae bacterium]|nr:hypothetical protein [Chitinophagaceae bacterium]
MKTLVPIFMLLPFLVQAQKGDTVMKYLDQNLNLTTSKNAYYYGVSVKRENSWYLYALYPDTTPLIKAYYADKALKIKEGPYTVYYPKNRKAQEGHYHKNKKVGVWRFWYEDGTIKDSGFIKDDVLIGDWKSWHPNGKLLAHSTFTDVEPTIATIIKDEGEHQLNQLLGIRNGPFSSWYPNGVLEAKGNFSNNAMSGLWTWYYENGNKATEEMYTNGSVSSLSCFDSTGKETDNLCSISKPALLKRYGDYKEYIYHNLTWPEEAKKKKLEGDVNVSFRITKYGQL